MLTTQHSMQNSLRWMRRIMVVILIIANLLTVILADSVPTAQGTQSTFRETRSQQAFHLFTNNHPSLGFYDASREAGANAPQLIITTR